MIQPAPSFQKIITSDNDLNRIQANVASAFNGLQGPFIGGSLLTGVSVGTSQTVINHGLGKQPRVWVICDQDTNTTIKRTSWDSNTITLQAGGACTISLWVS